METTQKERLTSAGVDLDGALERFMDNEKLYEKFLCKFIENPNFIELEKAFGQSDWEQALAISHNLKGVAGSLGFTHLYDLLCTQVSDLYNSRNDAAAALMEEIMPEYHRLLELARAII